MVYRNHLLGVHRRCHRLWESFEQQLERLKEVFGRLKEANLKLKPRKCSLFRREVEFLGHVVSSEGEGEGRQYLANAEVLNRTSGVPRSRGIL